MTRRTVTVARLALPAAQTLKLGSWVTVAITVTVRFAAAAAHRGPWRNGPRRGRPGGPGGAGWPGRPTLTGAVRRQVVFGKVAQAERPPPQWLATQLAIIGS